ncbi:uncharacterized protein LOC134271700 [Saccostrea cucullata]|uniref:uncharacterized protein LOC134271700 n=1 Tax=Saccostrea cuccullata TaxID=36930 RepID=UPI002ECFF49D
MATHINKNVGSDIDSSFSSSFCTELDEQMLVAMETLERPQRSQKANKIRAGLTSTPGCVTPLPRRQSQLMKSLFTLQSPLNDSFLSPFPSQNKSSSTKKGEENLTPATADSSVRLSRGGKSNRKKPRNVLNEIVIDKVKEGEGGLEEENNVIDLDLKGQRSRADENIGDVSSETQERVAENQEMIEFGVIFTVDTQHGIQNGCQAAENQRHIRDSYMSLRKRTSENCCYNNDYSLKLR